MGAASGSRKADRMDVDGKDGAELKIKGQAQAEQRKDEMDVDKEAVSLFVCSL